MTEMQSPRAGLSGARAGNVQCGGRPSSTRNRPVIQASGAQRAYLRLVLSRPWWVFPPVARHSMRSALPCDDDTPSPGSCSRLVLEALQEGRALTRCRTVQLEVRCG